jgi:hypothetical protein
MNISLRARLIFATIVALPLALSAQDPVPPRARTLVVHDANGGPVEGMQVIDKPSGKSVLTNSAGSASLGFMTQTSAGVFLRLRKVGYLQLDTVIAMKGDATDVVVTVQTAAGGAGTELPTVVTTAASEGFPGFGARCQAVSATCIRPSDIADSPSKPLGQFLVQTGVVEAVQGHCSRTTPPGCALVMRARYGGKCAPAMYMNGIRSPFTMDDIQNMVDPSDVKGIEAYRPGESIPPRFDAHNECGAIVFWTK